MRESKLASALNHRQLAVLRHGMNHSGYIYTIQQHKNTHGVAYDTARKDLVELSDKFRFFLKVKQGKSFVFVAPSDLEKRLLNKVQTT